MRQEIYFTGWCHVCGKCYSRKTCVTINPEDIAPQQCSCGGEVSFSTMEVHSRPAAKHELTRKQPWYLCVPSEAIADITVLFVVALSMAATALFLHCECLTGTLGLVVSVLCTALVVCLWLAGRAWFRSARRKEESELRDKFQAEGKLLRDREVKQQENKQNN